MDVEFRTFLFLIFGIDDAIIAVVAIGLSLVSTVLSMVMAPGPPKGPKAATADEFDFPTAEEGRPIPVVWGTHTIRGPNVVWHGDFSNTPIKKQGAVVGHHYFMGMHMPFVAAADELLQIMVGDREVWHGSVTGNQTINLAAGGIFGGDDGEGGISGPVGVLFGRTEQMPSGYLSTQIGKAVPAYRGVFALLLRGVFVGNSKYLKPWAVKVRRIPGAWYPETARVGDQCNPAHIIHEVLTSTDFGMGYPASIIDDADFRALADRLYGEGLGLGFAWSQQSTIEEMLQAVMDHVGGTLRLDRATGKFRCKLIRDDYDRATLPHLGPSNLLDLEQFRRATLGDLPNEIIVKWRTIAARDASYAVHNLANWQAQARIVSQTIEYPWAKTPNLAYRLAMRELRVRSSPLAAMRLKCNRAVAAMGLQPGDVFLFDWPDLGIEDMACRVGRVRGGTLDNGAVVIEAAEDVFGLGQTTFEPVEEDLPGYVAGPLIGDGPSVEIVAGVIARPNTLIWYWFTDLPVELWISTSTSFDGAFLAFRGSPPQTDLPGLLQPPHYFAQIADPGITYYGWLRVIDEYGRTTGFFPTVKETDANGVESTVFLPDLHATAGTWDASFGDLVTNGALLSDYINVPIGFP